MKKNKTTLEELLMQSKYQTCNVKIGSKQGSSFWYCGKGNIAYSITDIKKIRQRLLEQSHNQLKAFTYRLEHLDEIYEETFKEQLKKGIKNVESYKTNANIRKENERHLLPKKIESIEYDIHTHLLDRPIQEVVEGISPDEKPCWVI